MQLSVVEPEKNYRQYFDLEDRTVNGKPRYIFAATNEAEELYLVKCAEEQESVEKAKILIADGKKMYANDNLWGAAQNYKEGIRFDPSNVDAYSELGDTLLKLGLYRDALEPLNRALPLTRDMRLRSRIYDDIGLAKSKLGDQAHALSSFGLSLECNPRNHHALVRRGISHSITGQHDRAYTDALMALRLRPGYPPALQLKRKLEVSGCIPPLGATG
jgi:tetratricopeptide (TPR) repeat protein